MWIGDSPAVNGFRQNSEAKQMAIRRLLYVLMCSILLCVVFYSGGQYVYAATHSTTRKPAPAKHAQAPKPTPLPRAGSAVDKLDVHIEMKSHGLQQYQKPGEPLYQKLEQDWDINTDLVIDIYADKAISISKDPRQWKSCAEATTMCEVATGSNLTAPRIFGQPDPPKNPVKVSIQEKDWQQKDKDLQQTFRLSTANVLNDGEVSMHIAFMPPSETGPKSAPQLAGLAYKYRVVISGRSPGFGRTGPKPDTAERWDDFYKKWVDVSDERHVTLRDWHAISSTEYEELSEGDEIQYATIDDTKALETYFANPVGAKSFNLKAMYYNKTNDWLEEHWITLTLSPHAEKSTGK